MARKSESVLSRLQGALYILDNSKQRPVAEVVELVRGIVRDAVDVLHEPDPLKQRIAFVLLAIQQSTEIKQYERNGKQITRVRVSDLDLYNWAMSEVHAMAGAK